MIGDGEERARLEHLARGCARPLPRLTRWTIRAELLAASSAIVCSSREEGLGIGLLEAMAMERPVVGFAVGGVPEIVMDGVTGLLARPGSVGSLAAQLREAMRDLDRLSAMGRAARAWVLREASIEATCAAYREVYARVARTLVAVPGADR